MRRFALICLGVAFFAGCSEETSQDGLSDMRSSTPTQDMQFPPADVAPSIPDVGVDESMAPDIAWVPAHELGECTPPDTLAEDPLVVLEHINMVRRPDGPRVVHLLDIELDPTTGHIYSVGAGGLFILTFENNSFSVLGGSSASGIRGSFDKVEVLDGHLLALSSRERGLSIVDVSDPSNVRRIYTSEVDSPAGMAWSAPYLYVVTHDGTLAVFEVSDALDIRLAATLPGLTNPWEVQVRGDHAYVADNMAGLHVIDITEPQEPTILRTVRTTGGAQDIQVEDGFVYVAVGSAGIDIFSLVDPDYPERVSTVDLGSSVVSVSLSDGVLWAADHEGVLTVDVTTPADPKPLAAQRTEQWAMDVSSRGNYGFVADWGQISAFQISKDQMGPDIHVSRSEIFVVEGDEDIRLSITNRGNGPLDIAGISVDDDRFRVDLEKTELTPGESGVIRLLLTDDGASINASLCIASNDGDASTITIPIESNPSGASVGLGEPAPDFVLRDLDGETHQLSAQRGHPVVLIYFATW